MSAELTFETAVDACRALVDEGLSSGTTAGQAYNKIVVDPDSDPETIRGAAIEQLEIAAERLDQPHAAGAIALLGIGLDSIPSVLTRRAAAATALDIDPAALDEASASWAGLDPVSYLCELMAASLLGAESPSDYVAARRRSARPEEITSDLRLLTGEPSFRPGFFRDSVHGYVQFTSLEAAVLDEALVQRLRYISQSAAAKHVFPAVNTSRFEHSVGAMHVATRLLHNAIDNADKLRDRLLSACAVLVGSPLIPDQGWIEKNQEMRDKVARTTEALLLQGGTQPRHGTTTERLAVLVLEQAVRIASLLHDLGHLPFSHDFEIALSAHFSQQPEAARRWPHLAAVSEVSPKGLHEEIGRRLDRWLLDYLFASDEWQSRFPDTDLRNALAKAVSLAGAILRAGATDEDEARPPNNDKSRLLQWLYTLVSGEIDADRCDYVLRDGHAYSIPGVSYDIDRLVRSVCVIERGTRWETAVTASGVSAAEELLTARFRLYDWAIYHHKSQSVALCLRSAITALMDTHDDVKAFVDLLDDIVGSGRSDVGAPVRKTPRLDLVAAANELASWDEPRWIQLLKSVDTSADPDLNRDIRAFLYREGPGRPSVWKRATDFSAADVDRMNRAGRESGGQMKAWQAAARKVDVELVRLPFAPYRTKGTDDDTSRLMVRIGWMDNEAQIEPLSRRSAITRSLNKAWEGSLQIHSFHAGLVDEKKVWLDKDVRIKLKEHLLSQL